MTMRKILKFVFLAAVVAISISSPMLAADYNDPAFNGGGRSRSGLHAFAGAPRAHVRSGLRAFDMAPGTAFGPDSPSMTGGGSIGYNSHNLDDY